MTGETLLSRSFGFIAVALAAACSSGPALDEKTSVPADARAADLEPSRPRSYSATTLGEPRRVSPQQGTTGHTVSGMTKHLTYYGGRVISNVAVVAVDWTASVDPALSSYLPGFYAAVTGGPYFAWLAEYDTVGLSGTDGLPGSNQTIGYGTFGASYVITPTTTSSTTLDDTNVQAELSAQLGAGSLPAPELDSAGNVNSLYVFDFPPGYTVTLGSLTSCVQFCGYHGTIVYGSPARSIPYAVVMDMSPASPCHSGCGGAASYLDNSTSVHAHELIEAVTDTEVGLGAGPSGRPLAWYDDVGGEAGDLCNELEAELGTYTVQEIWSNANGACISVAPLCDGSVMPPSCTPCTPAADGSGCSGATPTCETDSTSARVGQCVGCTASSQCAGRTPICDRTDDTCRSCTPADCAGSAPVCGMAGLDTGQCVQCDEANSAACSGATPVCSGYPRFACVGCIGNDDCPRGSICARGACVRAHGGRDAGSEDGGLRPPFDSGGGPPDAATRDAGSASPHIYDGCSLATSGETPTTMPPALVAAGLAALAVRRRRLWLLRPRRDAAAARA